MKPQSFQVLLQLPPAQLSNVFETLSDLRDPLLQYVNKFTPQQVSYVLKYVEPSDNIPLQNWKDDFLFLHFKWAF